MQVFNSFDQPITDRPTVLTIGKFDGVHRGHQALITTAVQRARAQEMASAVLTFHPHPDVVLRPHQPVRLLSTLVERTELIAALDPEFLIIAPFNQDTMQTSAEEYMRRLCASMPLRELWIGEGFALGRKREGDVTRLGEIGRDLGYQVQALPPVQIDGERVTSSRVRGLLTEGVVEALPPLLGRWYWLRAVVGEGDRRGRTIGFPTANLEIDPLHALPADGVYACYATIERAPELLPAVTNIGVRPTFDGMRRKVEAHLLDWSGDLYNKQLKLEFRQRLRGERKFGGIDELRAQIAFDAQQARELLHVSS